jgi:hypothetical protein
MVVISATILVFWKISDFHENVRKFAKNLGKRYLNGIALCQLAVKLGLIVES